MIRTISASPGGSHFLLALRLWCIDILSLIVEHRENEELTAARWSSTRPYSWLWDNEGLPILVCGYRTIIAPNIVSCFVCRKKKTTIAVQHSPLSRLNKTRDRQANHTNQADGVGIGRGTHQHPSTGAPTAGPVVPVFSWRPKYQPIPSHVLRTRTMYTHARTFYMHNRRGSWAI